MNGHSFWGPILISCCIISIVWGQCLNGNENECVWSDDPSQPLRWIQKKGADERWVEVTKCPSPCGKAVLLSPWLPPRDREISWILRHKLFGHQKVTLQLSMKTEDSGPRQLFFEKGNYADGFPEFWKASKVVLPPVGKKHRLLLEAVTPYTDALVAVADVRTEAEETKARLPVETAPKTTPVQPDDPTSKKAVVLETRTVEPTSQKKEVSISTDTQTVEPTSQKKEASISTDTQTDLVDEEEEEDEMEKEDQLGSLQAGFGGHPDLRRGYTVIMDPNICMYP